VFVTPLAAGVRKETDAEIRMRDGTILRANVYLPQGGGPHPAILCAHPYGKDEVPRRTRAGWRINPQFRMLRQTGRIAISDETSWEAPDPGWWVPRGFALVNLDLRGAGRSDGVGSLMTDAEADDIHDVIEWIASQPWCDGGVAMLGVSYLAISQYKAAATQPPHLRAIVPWEGFTDPYRDLFYPGGVREIGFSRLWTTLVRRRTRTNPDIGAEAASRPVEDAWWDSLVPDLARIQVPMLVCGSFSDANLHSRGSFRAFTRVSSPERHLYTHRGGKWATFYGEEAKAFQLAFLERHLKGVPRELPRVRLEVRESRDAVRDVREEELWPPAARALTLHLGPDGELVSAPPAAPSTVSFPTRRRAASFSWTFDGDTEITGEIRLRLGVSAGRSVPLSLFAAVSKWSDGRFVPFEGSYGFGRDFVATGSERVPAGADPVDVEIGLSPSSTFFRAGDELRLHIGGRQLSPRNPLWGAFPALYRSSPRAVCAIHLGGPHHAALELPVVEPGGRPIRAG
jgi:predicted acyl esterase